MVVKVQFPDMPYHRDDEDLNETNANVVKFFRENSYGEIEMEFFNYPEIITTPETGAYYNNAGGNDRFRELRDFIQETLEDAGYEKGNQYYYYLANFPKLDNLGWSGISYGSRSGDNYTNGSYSTGLNAHELGHAFGLPHASSHDAGDDVIGDPSDKLEYGDVYDVMGGGGSTGDYNTNYKERIGWVEESEIATATESGVFRIYAHDNPEKSRILALKIPSGEVTYWLEYRTSYSSSRYNSRNGANVRLEDFFNRNTALLDMTPNSNTSSGSRDRQDGSLEVGESYTDELNNAFTINILAVNDEVWDHNGWVDVEVVIGGVGNKKQNETDAKQNFSFVQSADKFLFQPGNAGPIEVVLTNIRGEKVWSAVIETDRAVNTGKFPAGLYFLSGQAMGSDKASLYKVTLN